MSSILQAAGYAYEYWHFIVAVFIGSILVIAGVAIEIHSRKRKTIPKSGMSMFKQGFIIVGIGLIIIIFAYLWLKWQSRHTGYTKAVGALTTGEAALELVSMLR